MQNDLRLSPIVFLDSMYKHIVCKSFGGYSMKCNINLLKKYIKYFILLSLDPARKTAFVKLSTWSRKYYT